MALVGAQLVGVAVTATFSQQEFAASLGIDFPLLSDWDGEACRAYGVRYDTWKGHAGVAKRSLFAIDRHRIVRWRWSSDDAGVLPDVDEAIEVLAAIGTE